MTQNKQEQKHIVVIGAGAAGLMAAAAAAGQGCRVTVMEKNEKAGKKIYITGKGRCNLTNTCDTEEFFQYVVSNPKFLYSSIYSFDSSAVIDYFESRGCRIKIERGKRAFPVSDHASDVTRTLTDHLREMGVRILYNTEVSGIVTESLPGDPAAEEAGPAKKKKRPVRQTARVTGVLRKDGRTVPCDRVILCTGGCSYPATGSTGQGYEMAAAAGHSLIKPAPSLVPLTVKEEWPIRLQGLSLKNVEVTVFPLETEGEEDGHAAGKTAGKSRGKKKGRPMHQEFGEMLFTHFGITGPIILTASCYMDFDRYPGGFRVLLDLKPAIPLQELQERLEREFAAAPGKKLSNALRSLFPARLAQEVALLSGLGEDCPVQTIGKTAIGELAVLIKQIPMTATGTRGFREAIITRGGVRTAEVDPSTMESKIVKGLYMAGEVLDLDARTGGFNLQIAWSTGRLAGLSAAE